MLSNREVRFALKVLLTTLPPKQMREWYRSAGDCLCPLCDREYRLHPSDPEDEFLHILCNGDRVKL